jgi:Xaa-Pro aminopeptidase
MRYLPIDKRLFIRNRKRFVKKLEKKSIAVFNSNDIMPTSADGTHGFIQQTDLFYLSGIDQEESTLVICPEAKEEKFREILFLKETNEKIALWEGHKYSKDEATAVSGIKSVY